MQEISILIHDMEQLDFIRKEVRKLLLKKINIKNIDIAFKPIKYIPLGKLKPVYLDDIQPWTMEDDETYGIWGFCEKCALNNRDLISIPDSDSLILSIAGAVYCKDCQCILEYSLAERGVNIEVELFIRDGLPQNTTDFYRLKVLLNSKNLLGNNLKKLVKEFLPENKSLFELII